MRCESPLHEGSSTRKEDVVFLVDVLVHVHFQFAKPVQGCAEGGTCPVGGRVPIGELVHCLQSIAGLVMLMDHLLDWGLQCRVSILGGFFGFIRYVLANGRKYNLFLALHMVFKV